MEALAHHTWPPITKKHNANRVRPTDRNKCKKQENVQKYKCVCVCVVHDKTIYMAILKIKKQVEIDRPVVSTTNEAVRCSADVQCKPKHVRIESCVCVACESRSSFNCDLP